MDNLYKSSKSSNLTQKDRQKGGAHSHASQSITKGINEKKNAKHPNK